MVVALMTAGLTVVGYVSMALGVTVISIAFRTCSGWLPTAGAAPPVPRADDDGGAPPQ